jgi:aminoglycoside 3-N-acetyltransferase I
MNIEIRKLGGSDINLFQDLLRVLEDVFEMKDFVMPPKIYLQQLLEKNDFGVFVALSGGMVTGGLTTYTFHQYYTTAPLVYIYDMAVSREFHRKGIGTKLIAGLKDYCRSHGVEEVFVQVDKDDAHALEFYRSTGGVAQEVVHFDYRLN